LTTVLDATVAKQGIPAHRASAWHAWLGEAFADSFGAVAGGRAFGCALAEFVTLDVKAVRTEAQAYPNWEVYPTTALRLRVIAGALEALGDADGVKEVTARADAVMDGNAPMEAFHDDCAWIGRAWLETPLDALGKQSLLDIARVSSRHWSLVESVSAAALRSADSSPSTDIRALVSGARLAFEQEPDKYRLPTVGLKATRGDAQSRILTWIEKARATGVRSAAAADRSATDVERYDDAEAEAQLARLASQSDAAMDVTN
jgi:hypothetical protein